MLITRRSWVRSPHGPLFCHSFAGSRGERKNKKETLPGGESNPGLPRDRRRYSPLYYRGSLKRPLRRKDKIRTEPQRSPAHRTRLMVIGYRPLALACPWPWPTKFKQIKYNALDNSTTDCRLCRSARSALQHALEPRTWHPRPLLAPPPGGWGSTPNAAHRHSSTEHARAPHRNAHTTHNAGPPHSAPRHKILR